MIECLNVSDVPHDFIGQLKSTLSLVKIQISDLIDITYVRNFSLRIKRSILYNISYFPLDWFDDTDNIEPQVGGIDVQAVGLLPKVDKLSDEIRTWVQLNDAFEWSIITVQQYDKVRHKWNVLQTNTADSNLIHKIPKLLLIFPFENVNYVVHRIKRAIIARAQNEQSFKMGTIMDCINPCGLAKLPEEVKRRIWSFCNSTASWSDEKKNNALRPVEIEYCCIDGILEINIFGKHEFIMPLWLQPSRHTNISNIQSRKPENEGYLIDRKKFHASFRNFRLATVLSHRETVIAMQQIFHVDEELQQKSMFETSADGTKTLNEFNKVQLVAMASAMAYLNDIWMPNCCNKVKRCLLKLGRGAFDISVDNWVVYAQSKARKFITLINCRMADTLCNLVVNSINTYCEYLCEPCLVCTGVRTNFKWGDDLRWSPFQSSRSCIFGITIQIHEDKPYYSTLVSDFEATITLLLDNAVKGTHFVKKIDPFVMTNLTFPSGMYLSSLGLDCEFLKTKRKTLQESYALVMIPLIAYASEYTQFVKLNRINVDIFMEEVVSMGKTTKELNELIVWCRTWRERIDLSLPTEIRIGPFLILVQQLKISLMSKVELLQQRLLEFLAQKLTDEIITISEECIDIMGRLHRRPSSIDDLSTTIEWIAQSPGILSEIEHRIQMKILEHEILEEFLYAIEDEQATIKWRAVFFPYRIRLQIEPAKLMFETATEQFSTQQTKDLVSFGEQMDILNLSVLNFSNNTNVAASALYAIEANRIWNAMINTWKWAELLNRRQIFFERTKLDLNPLQTLQKSFSPFKLLWSTVDDFVKLRESTFGNPINNVDVDRVKDMASRFKCQLEQCPDAFHDLPSIQNVIYHFLDEMRIFRITVNILADIRHPDWILMHWQELCNVSGMEIRPFATMTFGHCIEKGIMEHRSLVKDISIRATAQREEKERHFTDEQMRMDYKNKKRGRMLN